MKLKVLIKANFQSLNTFLSYSKTIILNLRYAKVIFDEMMHLVLYNTIFNMLNLFLSYSKTCFF